jgi:energy-converting hydrogenase Eha subunit E
MLDSTGLSADMKALLFNTAKITIKVGDIVIAIGRRALDIAMSLIQKFPHMALGVVVALVLSSVNGAVPLVGFIVSAAFTKLLLLLGVSAGAI